MTNAKYQTPNDKWKAITHQNIYLLTYFLRKV
jgi:hypothetical protein